MKWLHTQAYHWISYQSSMEEWANHIEMVWACGKNIWVPYGKNGVDGRSKWRVGTRETEVRLDGWCKGGLGQQRNDGGGCATMHERLERVESPGAYATEWVSRNQFCLAMCSLGQPSHYLMVIAWRGVGRSYMMQLGWTVKKAQLLKIKRQVSSIWA